MLRAYAAVLRRRPFARALAAALLWGLGAAALPLALLLYAREAAGSFAAASAVVAVALAASALLGPLRARLADRLAPSRVLPLLAVASAAAVAALIAAGRAGAPTPALALLAALAAGCGAPVVPVLRKLVAQAFREESERRSGYALVSLLQEMSFVIGPLGAGVLAASSTSLALGCAAALTLSGALVFALSGMVRGAGARAGARRGGTLTHGLRTLVVVSALVGLGLGVLDVALPAFAVRAGAEAASGLLVSCVALGTSLGALAYGAASPRRPATRLLGPLALLAAAGLGPLAFVPSLALLAGLAAVAGLTLGPLLTCELGALDEVAAPGTGAESTAWTMSAFTVGAGGGAALAGQLVDRVGVAAGLGVAPLALGLVALLVAARPLRPAPLPPAGRAPG